MRALSIGLFAAASILMQPALADDNAPAADAQAQPAKNCLNLAFIRNTKVLDDSTIVFEVRGAKYYRNDLPNRCPRLGFNNSFSYSTSITQLCNVDIITVLENFGGRIQRGAACGLGKFHPITKEQYAELKAERKNKRKAKDDTEETSR